MYLYKVFLLNGGSIEVRAKTPREAWTKTEQWDLSPIHIKCLRKA